MRKVLSALLIFALTISLLAGCEARKEQDPPNNMQEEPSSTPPAKESTSTLDGEMFTDRDGDADYDESKAVTIQLNGTTATASSNSVRISGSTVTITEEATYIISGTLTDGRLIVDAPDTAKPQIVLKGASITNKTSAALYILEADKVFLTLADGASNSLANGGAFAAIDGNNIDAALFSKQDLTLNGKGALTVTSPAGHGIAGKDSLTITDGVYTIHSAAHGLDANDSVRIANATLNIKAGKDAIHAENTDDPSLGFVYIESGTIKAEAEGDGITAGADLQIADGTIELLTGGGAENGSKASSGNYGGFMGGGHGWMRPEESSEATVTTEDMVSMKGLKATGNLQISGGNITVNSADDSIHSDGSVTINGGAFTIASGDDALHAEDTLTVTDGKLDISECYEGLEALNIDVQGGEISLKARDDGLNAAGGADQSGTTGGRDGMFGEGPGMGGKPGGMGGGKPGGMGGHGGGFSNANGSIKISGGTLYINSSGDGLDANGTLEISGGHTTVVGPTQGDTATLDYDKSGIITGGTFIGTGAAGGMAQSFSDSVQGVIAERVDNQQAGVKIILKDQNGKTLIGHSPELNFAFVILSSPEIKKGESYTLTVGSASKELKAQ